MLMILDETANATFSFIYDAYVSIQRCNFHDADVPCDGANAMFIHDGASVRIYS